MRVFPTKFKDVKIIENFYQFDIRGNFIKLYNEEEFKRNGIDTSLKEVYYSTSQKDVIRGLHFQIPPYEHNKIIHVIQGSVTDVVVDLRKSSADYKKYLEISLSGNKPRSLYVPKGFAHGFKCLENNTIMLYQVSTGYSPMNDTGIAYNTIGYEWNIEDPIISERDMGFCSLAEFESPFI